MRHKYPRTPHLPFSLGCTSDDKMLSSLTHFNKKEVVATLKMDGENTSLYRDGSHARSLDGRTHPSRAWLKAFHASMAHNIPEGWRVCGENLYAQHSIRYSELSSYFMGFSVWTADNKALSWDDTLEFFETAGIVAVPTLYRGVFDEDALRKLASTLDPERDEGLVVRLVNTFDYEAFGLSVAKWVRSNHVQTGEHWMTAAVTPNKLAV